jgi:hypothetical protein
MPAAVVVEVGDPGGDLQARLGCPIHFNVMVAWGVELASATLVWTAGSPGVQVYLADLVDVGRADWSPASRTRGVPGAQRPEVAGHDGVRSHAHTGSFIVARAAAAADDEDDLEPL